MFLVKPGVCLRRRLRVAFDPEGRLPPPPPPLDPLERNSLDLKVGQSTLRTQSRPLRQTRRHHIRSRDHFHPLLQWETGVTDPTQRSTNKSIPNISC